MAARIGITPDIEAEKWQIEHDFHNTRNWKVTPEFSNKKDAKSWEVKTAAEKNVKTVKSNLDTKRIRIKWVGFYFEHDGPKR
ncbi:MAG: hypothetical protein CMP10_18550 [Zetaproteobacteria bacterium]|nr:hypothetical protein [Pseudobdellovibrionaceae bacterium]